MSTTWLHLIDALDKDYALDFETSCNGNKFFVYNRKTNKGVKFWFTEATWNVLKLHVDIQLKRPKL